MCVHCAMEYMDFVMYDQTTRCPSCLKMNNLIEECSHYSWCFIAKNRKLTIIKQITADMLTNRSSFKKIIPRYGIVDLMTSAELGLIRRWFVRYTCMIPHDKESHKVYKCLMRIASSLLLSPSFSLDVQIDWTFHKSWWVFNLDG